MIEDWEAMMSEDNVPQSDEQQDAENSSLVPELGIAIQQPVRVLFRNVETDYVKFFQALAMAAGNVAQKKYWGLPANLFDALKTVKIEPLNYQERTWLLIYRALLRGAAELVQPSVQFLEPEESERDALANNLDAILWEKEVIITRDFFLRPQELPILADFGELLRQWLIGWGLEESRAATVVERLPIFFVVALHEEWRERANDYEPALKTFDTPFIAESEYLLAWERYYALLRKQVQEAMFEESFSLQQVYIPLRAYYEEKKEGSDSSNRVSPEREPEKRRIVVDLREYLNAWLEKRDKDNALCVLSGGPGSGKSSSTKMWVAELSSQSKLRVLYLQLHQIDLRDNLENAVGDFVRESGLLPRNPLDAKENEQPLLLVFDGLDEIAKRGRASAELAHNFIVEVQRTLLQRNVFECRLQILIAGRELAVQSNTQNLRVVPVLHAIPYKLAETEIRRHDYQDNDNLLATDQRVEWWRKYGELTSSANSELPEFLQHSDLELEEVTAQPLLNYLVALSVQRGKIDFSRTGINLNLIYQDLLRGVHERAYEQKRLQVPELQQHEFELALEEIALAAWHGNGRTTTVGEIQNHCTRSGLSGLLEKFEEGAKSGVTRLLTAFYFRAHGHSASGDSTFEFTHKSFGEYLIARRIVRALGRISEELEEQRTRYRGWDERRALQEWADVCGPNALDEYILNFLRREVRLVAEADKKAADGKETVKRWQQDLCRLIEVVLQDGLPLELKASFKEMLRQANNAEEALLAAHSSCAYITRQIVSINWPDPTSFGTWLMRLQGQRQGPESGIALHSLNFLDLQGSALHFHDLYGANLIGSNLEKTFSTGVNMIGAKLVGANLRDARLVNANLRSANLRSANLRGAILHRAFLSGAFLSGADLSEAHLIGVDLSGVDLQNVKFRNANLSGADLSGANLIGAQLRRADLSNANLRDADLRKAILNYADLSNADLQGADLRDAEIVGVIGLLQLPLPLDSYAEIGEMDESDEDDSDLDEEEINAI